MSTKESLSQKDAPAFSPIRAFFWPIYGAELKKFIPMGLLMFFILFNYTALRSIKDTLVIGSGGTSVLPVLKFGVVLPFAILFMILYAKMANVFSKEKLFYAVTVPFLAYFALFAFVLYPNHEVLHLSAAWTESLQAEYPRVQSVFPVIANWSFSLIYVFAELWGSVMLSLMFWQFANEITKTQEAKRFYGMFGLIANFAMIAVGLFPLIQSIFDHYFLTAAAKFDFQITFTFSAVIVSCFILMGIYRWMNKNVLTDKRFYDPHDVPAKVGKKKAKLSVKESLSYVFRSKYLGMIALLVICYGIVIGCVEVVWKTQANLYYPENVDYKAFMDKYLAITGVVTIICMLSFKGIVGKFGWLRGAIMTPIMMLVTSVLFFAFIFMQDAFDPYFVALGTSSLFMAVIVGGIQNVLSKGTKYSLFDPTKEMAYIPLDQELKMKGKAAVDVVGGRLGKGGSGAINFALMAIVAGTIADVISYIAIIVVALLVVWLYAVGHLSKLYHKALKDSEKAIAHDDKVKVANDAHKKIEAPKAA
ncbi:MAG: NTP/NDP exchange transporter [Alphaproteobacteria bacterium]|nr:NTP/NDP exchange transporter [Alphaproteobacteria bacterium]MBP9877537.1 NTP/NDP exchange transporter [Alphaproteobacteria bacterium]